MPELLEALMIISFGISWPINFIKAYKARTTVGSSFFFLMLIFFGYICGIASKLVSLLNGKPLTYVFVFYVINIIVVGANMVIYFRNSHIDKMNGKK